MATFNKFQDFVQQLAEGNHDFNLHVYKVALTNTAPLATQTNWNTTDHPAPAAANGYPAGGSATTTSSAEVAGMETVSGTQVVFTATAGGIGPFQYAILYNDNAATKYVVGWWNYGSAVTLADTETFTVKFSNTSPGAIFTLA